MTEYGVNAEYHNIAVLQVNWEERSSVVVLNSYASESTRRENATPLKVWSLHFSGEDFPFDGEHVSRSIAYESIKMLDEWENATDC